jgi:D-glycero-D-manno-heptose 1,7-bisphosphate phosphatase
MGDRSALRLVVLDRDGILNEDRDDYVKSADEWVPIPGALEAVAKLHQAGWHVVVATNQSGLGRGLFDMYTLNEMHLKMNALLAPLGGKVDAVFFCPHAPEDNCRCRKPLPGLFEDIRVRFGLDDMAAVPAVGNTLRDLQAATAVGCAPHLVRTGKAATLDDMGVQALRDQMPGLVVHASLTAFADALLGAERKKHRATRAEGKRLASGGAPAATSTPTST